jgi:hypothetical protein
MKQSEFISLSISIMVAPHLNAIGAGICVAINFVLLVSYLARGK